MKKLILASLFALIITFPILSYATVEGYETIKLGLFFGSTAKSEVVLTASGGFRLGFYNGVFEEFSGLIEEEVRILINADGLVEIDGIYANDTAQTLALYPNEGFLAVNGTKYRGGILFLPKDGKMTVVNAVGLEEYLYSVVGKEMSPSWHIEALKAQAVCARTYAVNNWKKYETYGFNLCTTQSSQVYPGVSGETDSTRRSVDETAGLLVKYNGKLAQTFFYASSGGKTANVKYVWGSEFPYLVAVDDPYEDQKTASYATWSETLTADDIEKKLANAGVNIGKVTNVEVTGQNEGTVYLLKFTGTNGEHEIKNEKTRTLLGLKSQFYTISGGVSGKAAGNWANIVRMARGVAPVFGGNGTFVFNGKAWGHRVGMSQCGAKGMAEAGFAAADILTHYFPGCIVE